MDTTSLDAALRRQVYDHAFAHGMPPTIAALAQSTRLPPPISSAKAWGGSPALEWSCCSRQAERS